MNFAKRHAEVEEVKGFLGVDLVGCGDELKLRVWDLADSLNCEPHQWGILRAGLPGQARWCRSAMGLVSEDREDVAARPVLLGAAKDPKDRDRVAPSPGMQAVRRETVPPSLRWLHDVGDRGATSKPGEGDQLLQASGAQKRDMGDESHFLVRMVIRGVADFGISMMKSRIMKHDYIVKCPGVAWYIGCVLEYPNLAIVTEHLIGSLPESSEEVWDNRGCCRKSRERDPVAGSVHLPDTRLVVRMAAVLLQPQYINGIALKAALRLKPPLIHRDLKTQNLVRCIPRRTETEGRKVRCRFQVPVSGFDDTLAGTPRTLESGDSRLWTSIFSALGREQRWAESCHFLQTLRESRHKHLDTIVYNAVIKACERSSQWLQALQCLWELQMNKLQPDLVTFNTIISALQKGHRWQKALLMMDQVTSPDAVTCSAVVQACERGGRWDLALKYFLEARAQDESLRLDLIAVNAAVNALSRSKAPGVLLQDPKSLWRQAFQLWNALVDRGLQGDLITSNTLANAGGVTWLASLRVLATWRRRALQVDSLGISATLGQAVDWRLGLALFTAATVDGTADLVLQNALCTLLERQDQWQRSLRFDTEQDMDLVAGACLLSACARGKLWAEALSTAQRLRSAGLEGNAMLGTSALTALEDHWRRASRLLDFLQLGQPNMVHIATLLMGDASRSAWNMALARFPRHEEMVTKRMSGPVARNCALVAMKKAWSWSLQLLEAVTPDVVSFNSAMESCGPLGGQWDFALLLLEVSQRTSTSNCLGAPPGDDCRRAGSIQAFQAP
ncbi:unnamed protein product [Durusdinium trenchii]|uniref:Pentatricopeptide repeat-containing protein, chloroplastic n=1 Tax=Durusdinium trenchii TaxID=1381693 RepID=A0ABP0KU59_9DINO